MTFSKIKNLTALNNHINYKIILQCFIVLCATQLPGQIKSFGPLNTFTEGFVVKMNGDTIRGKIRCTKDKYESPYQIFINLKEGEKLELLAADVKSLVQSLPEDKRLPERDFVIFDKIKNPKFQDSLMLTERISPLDKITIYFDVSGNVRQNQMVDNKLVEGVVNMSYLLKKDEEVIVVKKGDYKSKLPGFFNGCKAFTVDSIIRSKWDQMRMLIDKYNNECK